MLKLVINEQMRAACTFDEFGAGTGAELLLDVGPAGLDGAHRGVKRGGDLGVGVAAGDSPEHLQFAFR